ncbi:MAG: response regulator transcription factor [Gammaproteobacteria bacterium]|nr:response regulator transcription factor [Gammaproteobacteria bacterium]
MNAIIKTTLALLMPDSVLRSSILTSLSSQFDIKIYDSVQSFIEAEQERPAELLLCDQTLLETQQSIILASLKTTSPNAQILVIGPSRPIADQIAVLRHGARGYFDSSLSTDKLSEALNSILHGEAWVERHVISGLIDELTHIPEITQQQRQAVESLSPKELEVAKLVSHGATNKMIADKMSITERTVKAHLTTIFNKMDLPDRLSLAILFRDLR